MFIRKKEVVCKKTGKKYSYCKLVESVQTEHGPRQRLILHLGKLELSKVEIKTLGKILEFRISGKRETVIVPVLSQLADEFIEKYNSTIEQQNSKTLEKEQANYQSVDLNTVTTKNHRSYGPEFVTSSFWKKLGIDSILSELGFSSKEICLAKAIVLGRIISPGSELHTYNWLQNRSSLNEEMKFNLNNVGKDAFYEIGDLLFQFKDEIEKQLRINTSKFYSLKNTIYLYDLTNTYFEGAKLKSDLAKHGKSKEKRYDCPLVTLALVVDQLGFPVYSEIYKGNQSEPETLKETLDKIFAKSQSAVVKPVDCSIIMDRGIATSENKDYLKENGFSYFVVDRKNNLNEYKKDFADKNEFTEYKTSSSDSVFLKKVEKEDVSQVLVFSTGKDRKEKSIIGKKEERFLTDVERLISSNQKGNIVQSDKINVRIGRLKERYGAIANSYSITLVPDKSKPEKVLSISHKKNGKQPVKKEFSGCYIIETDKKGYSAKEIWDIYMQLNQVEAAFRSMKSELGTRPIYHQLDDRIKSHLFITVFAYSILHSIEYELGQNGMNKSWKTIKQTLSTHQRSTIVLKGENDTMHSIRVTGNPEKDHREIYEKLNIKFKPNRKYEMLNMRL
ncbi:MAG: IS1634 family transposase [Proteobacteria bacterium]|nr:IS1634 family transposase [Pseudomonadota bacterium]